MIQFLTELDKWLLAKEDEHVEFKEAKQAIDFNRLVKYCVALANEGGGAMILGVTDKPPRTIVGTAALPNLDTAKYTLMEKTRLRIEIDEISTPQGRVLLIRVPSRPLGMPVHYEGQYLMRVGDSLAPMLPDVLKKIFDETAVDYSAEICTKASMSDLDVSAIEDFRNRWIRKSGNQALRGLSAKELLSDGELLTEAGLTNAALVLFGTRESLGRLLAQAEVIFEYRSSDITGPAQFRREFRQGFFCFYNEIWREINLRNDRQHYQDGLFVWDIPTFNESAVREALLNAISHRDYRMAGSVFIRQYPRSLSIGSPGGLPNGITIENILWEQSPRNRRIAETFGRCGFVERSGQGMNKILECCILEGKPKPDFGGTDPYHVWLTLHGEVQNPEFLRFLEKIGKDRVQSFSTRDLLVIDHVFRDEPVGEGFKRNLSKLVENGVVELVGRGRGSRYILSRQFYEFIGKKGVYTRKRWLDRDTNKMLLLKHIVDSRHVGTPIRDLIQVLPMLSRRQVQGLVGELESEGLITGRGNTRARLWYAAQLAPN